MARRMRSAWGSVQRLGPNRYRLRWWEDRGGDYARRSEVVRGTRKEATRRLAEIRAGLDETAPHGRPRARRKMTVGEAYETWWLPETEERVERGALARQSLTNYLSRWRKYVKPRWADVACADVRPADVQEWLLTMTRKPAADALYVLRAVLDRAVLFEVVASNPARARYRMPQEQVDRTDGAYTLAELDRIAQAARGRVTEAAILLMAFGSCRTGESLGVRVDEVARVTSHGLDLTTAEIVRQVTSDRRVSADGELKNRQSVRTVVVPPPWGDRLWELAQEAQARGDAWLTDSGLGRPVYQHRLRRDWAASTEAAGLPPKAARAARRSWETFMRWEMGVSPSKIEAMMGHRLPGVTGEHYDKPDAAMFVDAVAEAFARKPFVRSS